MPRFADSRSPKPEQVAEHYSSGYEAGRLSAGTSQLERERTRDLLARFLPPPPAIILDVGGGPGGHALWLAQRGYRVHLFDITPLHVELARAASAAQPDAPLASAQVGDACSLPWPAETSDAVLLFGPLYHLTDARDRLSALGEAYRVLQPGGLVFAVGISRFASLLDGLDSGYLEDSRFAEIVKEDLKTGQHRNPTSQPEYFMDTFFHHPDELRAEVAAAGFEVRGIYGIEGPCWVASRFEAWWNDRTLRELLLQIARAVEIEPSLLGASPHLLAVGRK